MTDKNTKILFETSNLVAFHWQSWNKILTMQCSKNQQFKLNA